MDKVAFFCDTDCDLTYDDTVKYGINLINMPVYLDSEVYNLDLKNNGEFKDFYQALRDKKTPTTAAINEQEYIDTWKPFLEKGQDILYVAFSSKLSNTFEHMFKAIETLKKQFPKQTVYYADTKSISGGGALIAIQAACKLKAGVAPAEIVKFVEKKSKETTAMFIVENLDHLRRGGRISGTSAMIGGLLDIKPILYIDTDGKLVKWSKAKGFKKALLDVFEIFKEQYAPTENAKIYILHADALEHAKFLRDKIAQFIKDDEIVVLRSVGPIVAAHSGPGTVGIAFNRRA